MNRLIVGGGYVNDMHKGFKKILKEGAYLFLYAPTFSRDIFEIFLPLLKIRILEKKNINRADLLFGPK